LFQFPLSNASTEEAALVELDRFATGMYPGCFN
jgi:hypothetical protein